MQISFHSMQFLQLPPILQAPILTYTLIISEVCIMDKKDIIIRIGQIRQRANLSARDLSLKIGKNSAYISRLESKDSFEPSVSVLLDIISVCGSTESEFFYYDIQQYQKDKEIIELLKTASPIKKDSIINLLKNR